MGRLALVTSASSGMGQAAAVALAERDARVIAVARREAELSRLASEINGEYVACDLTTEEGCSLAVARGAAVPRSGRDSGQQFPMLFRVEWDQRTVSYGCPRR